MGMFSPSIYRGHGIFGDEAPPTRPHPVMMAELLNPESDLWKPSNVYLRLFPRELELLIADLSFQAVDRRLSPLERGHAKTRLTGLRQRMARYFGTTGRTAGRPSKLTLSEREEMSQEYDRVQRLIRDVTSIGSPSSLVLHRLFKTREFQVVLFGQFPPRVPVSETAWKEFLRLTIHLPLAARCLHYLAFQYDVSIHTIQAAVWPRNIPASQRSKV
jgi:hypothetical protein